MNFHYLRFNIWRFIPIPGVQLRIVYGHSRSVLSMEIGAFDALFVCIYAKYVVLFDALFEYV